METLLPSVTDSFEWKVFSLNNILRGYLDAGERFVSDSISCGGLEWTVQLKGEDLKDNRCGWISVRLLVNGPFPVRALYNCSVESDQKKQLHSLIADPAVQWNNTMDCWGKKAIERHVLVDVNFISIRYTIEVIQKVMHKSKCSVPIQSHFKKDMERLFEQKYHADVKFVFENQNQKEILAHRSLLSARSGVMALMFNNENWKDTKTGEIHIKDAKWEEFSEFMRYIYTDKCSLKSENIFPMYGLAHYYNVETLLIECRLHLVRSFTYDNVSEILVHAHKFCDEYLKLQCWEYIKNNIAQIAQTDTYKNLKRDSVGFLLNVIENGLVNDKKRKRKH